MFGYMFGDVGQGLRHRRRWRGGTASASPIARLLMVGGLSAAVFGLLFGSVFGLHGAAAGAVAAPAGRAAGGAARAAGRWRAAADRWGWALDALAAWWRGEMRRWLLTDAALIVVYLGLLAAFFAPPACRSPPPARCPSASGTPSTPGASRRRWARSAS